MEQRDNDSDPFISIGWHSALILNKLKTRSQLTDKPTEEIADRSDTKSPPGDEHPRRSLP